MPGEATERTSYYRSALHLLQFVEHRAPTQRRFGSQADALWSAYAGALDVRDRLELLLRDADAQWKGAFGARTTFNLTAVAEDDAFGPEWELLDGVQAGSLWRDLERDKPAGDVGQLLAKLDKVWGRKPKGFELPKISPSSRLVVAGVDATVAVIGRFLADRDLSWADQVVVIADAAMPRQYAAAAIALLDIDLGNRPRPLVSSEEAEERAKELGQGRTMLVSADAEPQAKAAAKRLGGG